MAILETYKKLEKIALGEFTDIVVNAEILLLSTGDPHKLRLDITDGSLIDVFFSRTGRYSYHWERRLIDAGDLYRHDDAPHNRWRDVLTFPKHFHNGSEDIVTDSYISNDPEQAIREFLVFVRRKLLGVL